MPISFTVVVRNGDRHPSESARDSCSPDRTPAMSRLKPFAKSLSGFSAHTSRVLSDSDRASPHGRCAHAELADNLTPTDTVGTQFFGFIPPEDSWGTTNRLARFCSTHTGILQAGHDSF